MLLCFKRFIIAVFLGFVKVEKKKKLALIKEKAKKEGF